MPIPLIPVLSALAAGGSLVPHAAGGLIVSGASGYVAGTYLSTSAIAALLTTAGTAGVAGLAAFTGLLSSAAGAVSSGTSAAIGSTGILGTSIGASGIKGALVSLGVIPTVSVALPFALGGAAVAGSAYLLYRHKNRYKALVGKIVDTPAGDEAVFTEAEAKQVERIILLLAKKDNDE
ncbi:hypothetical protein [Marinobacterium marinum]|uniref:Transmembrane protein n=1 Tax=Marinobacterium marinum TaxID=2756129 RepID=A0A7W2AAZ3_9GAMM|nr:hypothetical protein [Marinobacterium marinum]MBA4500864.1 hypothetical protein [Marinobacterium marinum]